MPRIWKLYNTLKLLAGSTDDDLHKDNLPQWVKDFKLAEWGKQALFFEYLEMGTSCDLNAFYSTLYLVS